MSVRKLGFVTAISLFTAFSLAGSIALPFFLLDLLDNRFGIVGNPHYSGFFIIPLALAIIFGSFLAGGALWGLGIAWLTKIRASNLIRSGAFIWAVNVFVAGFILYFSQIPGADIDKHTSLEAHAIFTILFLPGLDWRLRL